LRAIAQGAIADEQRPAVERRSERPAAVKRVRVARRMQYVTVAKGSGGAALRAIAQGAIADEQRPAVERTK
jgi:hypothetical protein